MVLVHVSELSWQHVAHPKDVVSEGQAVRVKVLKVDPAAGKISLSIKAAQPGPWETAGDKFNSGDIVTGTVRRHRKLLARLLKSLLALKVLFTFPKSLTAMSQLLMKC